MDNYKNAIFRQHLNVQNQAAPQKQATNQSAPFEQNQHGAYYEMDQQCDGASNNTDPIQPPSSVSSLRQSQSNYGSNLPIVNDQGVN